jgi:hypothetical protein
MRPIRPALLAASAAAISASCVVAMAGTALAAGTSPAPAPAVSSTGLVPVRLPSRPVATTPPVAPTAAR